MFRLIKLALYAFVGYALYELFQGMTARQGGSRAFGGPSARGIRGESFSDESFGSGGQNLTGEGRGQTVETLDSDGGSIRHKVGRGVIST